MNLKFMGLELRTRDNIKNIYSDVDKLLASSANKGGNVSEQMRAATTAHALHKLFKQSNFFSVCTISELENMTGVVIPAERKSIYKSIHCLHYNEMLPDFRQMIVAMVLDDFRDILNPQTVSEPLTIINS